MSDYRDLGRGPARHFREQRVDGRFRFIGEFVAREQKINGKRDRRRRLRRERCAKIFFDRVFTCASLFRRAVVAGPRRRVGAVEHHFLLGLLHYHRTGRAVGMRQQDDCIGRDARATGGKGYDDHRHQKSQAHFHSPACTTNSVPRTPSMVDGVVTVIASGERLASLPDITDSVPRFSVVSKLPSCVVELKLKRLIASVLLGPTDRRELSTKVMPAEPSAPVTMLSDASTFVPTGPGRRCPARAMETDPLDSFTWPTLSADTGAAASQAIPAASPPTSRCDLFSSLPPRWQS